VEVIFAERVALSSCPEELPIATNGLLPDLPALPASYQKFCLTCRLLAAVFDFFNKRGVTRVFSH
jgi:hypothetical protein